LISPADGASTTIPVTNIPFTWSRVVNSTNYIFTLSTNDDLSANDDFSARIITKNVTGTVFTYTETLEKNTPYYWQVKAWKNSNILSVSNIGTFTIIEAPPPPVEVTPAPPAPVINLPPTQQISPTWIYTIIGVGVVLAIVVIVLIVRRRRRF